MRTLLKEYGITPGPDLDLLLHRAWQVHQLRGGEGDQVSRSSLLYAAATVEPLVLTLLETNGLEFRAWEQLLGFEARPQFESPDQSPIDVDFQVNPESTGIALREFHARWPTRTLDILGVSAAILLFQMSDWLARPLEAAGFHPDDGPNRFRAFVDASPEGFLIQRDVFDGVLTNLSHEVLNAAEGIIREYGIRFPAITTSELFVAAIRTQIAETPTSPAFLRDWIVQAAQGRDLDAYVRQWMAFYNLGDSPLKAVPFLTPPTAAVIERARVLAEQVTKAEKISARHLIGALVASRRWAASAGVTDFLRGLDINPYAVAGAYYEYLNTAPTASSGRDNMPLWRTFLGLRDDSFLPRFNAEDVSGEDLLNVSDDVNAFATLIASKRIQPPLSIGLFGDWGSGKSFFMAQMRRKVAEYAVRGNNRPDGQFHGRVVQIEFNAWHYVEANLWASLVEHLFRNLKLTFEKPNAQAISERREELLGKLDVLLAKRADAEKKVQEAELKRDQVTQELDAQKKAAEASAALASGLRAQDVWELVNIGDTDREALQKELNALGAGTVLQSKEDVRKTVDELRSVAGRTKLLANWVVQQPRALVLLLVLLVLAPFGAQAVISILMAVNPKLVSDIFQTMVQITAFVGAGVSWIAKRLSTGRSILDRIDAARATIDARIQKAEQDRQEKIEAADQMLIDAQTEVANTKASVQDTEKEVADAKAELLKLTTDYRLTRFIDERAASDDYRKLLGVLATVRNDFQMLSDLMNEPHENNVSETSRIDRIVLYIDDLDRCPPEKVVDVLQAVHLLLAFKLFVVVVGVDARWISESLEQHHRALRAKTQDDDARKSSVIGYEVRPHDYLEKIFQVPFWLERLQWEKTSQYMGKLLADDVARAGGGVPRGAPVPDNGNGNTGDAQTIETRKLHYTLGDDDAPESDPKQLTIEDKELAYMTSEQLAELVGRSPRTAKRFVNTYRFFRASIPAQRLERYLREGLPTEYQCALLLLGMVVGAPDISPEVFALLEKADDEETVKDFTAKLPADGKNEDQWAAVRAALGHFDRSAKLRHLKPHIARVSRFSFRAPYAARTAPAPHQATARVPVRKTPASSPVQP
jgi:hypothetical protein